MNAQDTETNQRSLPRLPAQSCVWFRCRRAGADADLANGLLDLSEGGVQFLARELLNVGESVEVALQGSRTADTIRRQCEVRWVVAIGSQACCVGVRFYQPLSAAELEALAEAPVAETAEWSFEPCNPFRRFVTSSGSWCKFLQTKGLRRAALFSPPRLCYCALDGRMSVSFTEE